jgi:hypothetical protein
MIQELVTNNWLTIYLVFLLGLLVAVNYLFPIRFRDFYLLHNTNQYLVKYQSTTNVFFSFNLALFLFQTIIFSLLLFKLISIYQNNIENDFYLFLKILGIYTSYLTVRYILGKVICSSINLVKEQEELSFIKTTYLSKISIYIFPFIIIGIYLPIKTDYLFFILSLITLIFCLFYYINIIKYYQQKMFGKWYYFILYLCALEIGPILLLYKVLV